MSTVGRTHSIVRLQTRNRSKDHGTEDLGGFVYVLDKFPQRDLGLWVFMYPINITLFCLYFVSILCLSLRLPRRGLSRPFLATTGYHACVYIPSRFPHQSYHAQPIHVHRVITPAISYSYFVVLSFAGFYATCASPPTPPLGATRHNLLNRVGVY